MLMNFVCVAAYFQYGFPIYSAKSLRFRMGHPKSLKDIESNVAGESKFVRGLIDKFVWTYTSPEFPMLQVSCTIYTHGCYLCPMFDIPSAIT